MQAQAEINIIMFDIFAPFFKNTTAIGKAIYSGPVGSIPRKIERKIPFIPEAFPMYLVIISSGTQTEKSPIIIIAAGIIINRSRKYFFDALSVGADLSGKIKRIAAASAATNAIII